MAVAALPLVWAFQYSGGAGPQWGGRYTLLSGALLLVAATVVLEGHRNALVAACLVAALVTGFGLAWLSVRSHWVAHGIEQIVDRHDQAVISGEAHVLREGGAFYDDSRHWLTSTSPPELDRAVRHRAGRRRHRVRLRRQRRREDPGRRSAGTCGRRRTCQFLRPDIYLQVATFRQHVSDSGAGCCCVETSQSLRLITLALLTLSERSPSTTSGSVLAPSCRYPRDEQLGRVAPTSAPRWSSSG